MCLIRGLLGELTRFSSTGASKLLGKTVVLMMSNFAAPSTVSINARTTLHVMMRIRWMKRIGGRRKSRSVGMTMGSLKDSVHRTISLSLLIHGSTVMGSRIGLMRTFSRFVSIQTTSATATLETGIEESMLWSHVRNRWWRLHNRHGMCGRSRRWSRIHRNMVFWFRWCWRWWCCSNGS